VTSVNPGQKNVSTPKMMAQIPRSRMSHQFRARPSSIGRIKTVPGGYVCVGMLTSCGRRVSGVLTYPSNHKGA
jgi:hypothetical protein